MKTSEIMETADTGDVDIEKVVKNLTGIVEEEVAAFQALLDTLLDQQASILTGDSAQVKSTNDKVVQIMANTRQLEKERHGESKLLSQHFEMEMEDALNLTALIPLVERKYARRLEELRDILTMLMQKIHKTNKRNNYLLDHSLAFVDNCMRVLVEGQYTQSVYSGKGKMAGGRTSLYSGVG